MGIKIVGDATLGLNDMVSELSKRSHLEIGISDDASPETIMKAVVNEFGYDSPGIPVTDAMRKWFAAQGWPLKKETRYIKIPARPFISKGIYDNLPDIWAKMDSLIDLVHRRKLRIKDAMPILGAYIVKSIQKYIDEGDHKPNHPMTVENKGHAHPLIGHGGLKDSITFEVKPGRGK